MEIRAVFAPSWMIKIWKAIHDFIARKSSSTCFLIGRSLEDSAFGVLMAATSAVRSHQTHVPGEHWHDIPVDM